MLYVHVLAHHPKNDTVECYVIASSMSHRCATQEMSEFVKVREGMGDSRKHG